MRLERSDSEGSRSYGGDALGLRGHQELDSSWVSGCVLAGSAAEIYPLSSAGKSVEVASTKEPIGETAVT